MKRRLPFAMALILSVSAACAGTTQPTPEPDDTTAAGNVNNLSATDSASKEEMDELVQLVLTEMPASDEKVKYDTLTEEDFKIVANELGVEIAAIKAVVKIEAGPKLQGFWAPGVPVANYVQSLFNKYKGKGQGRKLKDAKVPSGLSGYALKEWTSLTNARKINADAADMGTYWGMFQIGGFNYKLCGCQSVEEMVAKVCKSEFSQLEMFAVFIRNSGMLEALQKKDWATFARKYNGPAYAKRGYHTRMAKEYANYKSQASESKQSVKHDSDKAPEMKSGVDQTPVEVKKESTSASKKKTA
ncbi:MAG: N-acetylmuramidase family protein, partial [Muribaculaceae bacterium]|nr:N-acetylmuramidase family protein [Muribaculaceae bacterium]